MIDVQRYEETETLKDGRAVIVRAIQPADKETLVKGIDQFSVDSLYKRFHGIKRGLTDQELKFYTEVDYLHHVALVVVLKDSAQLMGGGRYISYNESLPPRSAELAFAVVDNYQGLGMGSIVLKHLIIIARDVGFVQFEADVLFENSAMTKVFEKSGLPLTKKYEGQNIHITMTL